MGIEELKEEILPSAFYSISDDLKEKIAFPFFFSTLFLLLADSRCSHIMDGPH